MRMEPVTIHLPRDLKRWLEKDAKSIDLSLAAYVRRALKLYRHQQEEAESHGRAPEPTAEPTAGES